MIVSFLSLNYRSLSHIHALSIVLTIFGMIVSEKHFIFKIKVSSKCIFHVCIIVQKGNIDITPLFNGWEFMHSYYELSLAGPSRSKPMLCICQNVVFRHDWGCISQWCQCLMNPASARHGRVPKHPWTCTSNVNSPIGCVPFSKGKCKKYHQLTTNWAWNWC